MATWAHVVRHEDDQRMTAHTTWLQCARRVCQALRAKSTDVLYLLYIDKVSVSPSEFHEGFDVADHALSCDACSISSDDGAFHIAEDLPPPIRRRNRAPKALELVSKDVRIVFFVRGRTWDRGGDINMF